MLKYDDCRWLVVWENGDCMCQVQNETLPDIATMQNEFCKYCKEYRVYDLKDNGHLEL